MITGDIDWEAAYELGRRIEEDAEFERRHPGVRVIRLYRHGSNAVHLSSSPPQHEKSCPESEYSPWYYGYEEEEDKCICDLEARLRLYRLGHRFRNADPLPTAILINS